MSVFDITLAEHDNDKKKDQIFRLRDIETEEVSIVDRAANKRRFLLVKRENGMGDTNLGPEVIVDDNGSYATDGDTSQEDVDVADDTQGIEKQKFTIPRPVKTAVTRMLTDASVRLASVLKAVEGAEATDEKLDMPLPAPIAQELRTIAQRIMGYPAAKMNDGVAPIDPKPVAESVEKAGARIARSRLMRLQNVLTSLESLVKELVGESEKKPDGPNAGSAQVSKSDEVAETKMLGEISQLTKTVERQMEIQKRQEEELEKIRKSVVGPNSIPVDGGDAPAAAEDVSWPMDMNRPINKETVTKSKSFIDI